MNADILHLAGVRKSFPGPSGRGQLEALHVSELTVRRGEFLAVAGPSGGGKEGMELTHQDSPLIEGCRRLRRDPAPDVRIFLSLSHYCEILSEECRP